METFRLKSMTDFVLNQKQSESFNEKTFINEELMSLEKIRNYAKFLKQPLKLEMFIGEDSIFIFQWEFKEWNDLDMENQKIEDLLNDDLIYVLNDNAIKQIGI